MRLVMVLMTMLLPTISMAQIPAIEQLGNEASQHENVEYESVGSFMLDHIDLIECRNAAHEQTLEQRTLAIAKSIGATYLASSTDERGRNDVYILKKGDIVNEVIIITHGKNGGLAVVVMSGNIPINRLGELSKLSNPKKE